ncbi:hypothetical protein ACFLYV_03880 [Chloroflexota bacterium]
MERQLSQIITQPLRTRIDQNMMELEQLQQKLDSLSSERGALNLEIDDIERSILPYQDQMDAIQNRYPSLVLPPAIFDEYEELRTETNKLIDLRNEVANSVNDLNQQYNQIVEEFNLMTDQTNQLNEELAWLY